MLFYPFMFKCFYDNCILKKKKKLLPEVAKMKIPLMLLIPMERNRRLIFDNIIFVSIFLKKYTQTKLTYNCYTNKNKYQTLIYA